MDMTRKEIIEKQLLDTLRYFGEISEQDWGSLIQHFNFKEFKKGEIILKPGDRADFSFFIGKGLIKKYFLTENGKEVITNFDGENRMVSDYVSLIQGSPSRIYIEAIEDTETLLSSYGFKDKVEKNSAFWQKNNRILAEKRYVEKCDREYNLLFYKAEKRLEVFKEEFGNTFSRIAQKDIASYLGITPQSLSRLLNKPD